MDISAPDTPRWVQRCEHFDRALLLLRDGVAMLDARNEMSHAYREQAFDRVLADLRARFLERFEDLHDMLLHERLKIEDG